MISNSPTFQTLTETASAEEAIEYITIGPHIAVNDPPFCYLYFDQASRKVISEFDDFPSGQVTFSLEIPYETPPGDGPPVADSELWSHQTALEYVDDIVSDLMSYRLTATTAYVGISEISYQGFELCTRGEEAADDKFWLVTGTIRWPTVTA